MIAKHILAVVIVLGIGVLLSYSLYWYNYNEAKDAMSMMMPEFILANEVYAQGQNDTTTAAAEDENNPALQALQRAREELNLRRNQSTVNAPTPIMFNSIKEGDIAPMPMENQIMIEIRVIIPGSGRTDLGWRGNIMYNDGTDMLCFDGVYEDYILVNCFAYDRYAVSFQKTDAEGNLQVQIWYRDADYDNPGGLGGQKILDEGRTEAAFGIVQLSGTCKDPDLSN